MLWKIKNNKIDYFLYFLLVFSYLLDPTGKIVNLKLPTIFALIGWKIWEFKGFNTKNFLFFLIIYIILSISTLNMLLMDYRYAPELFLSYYKSFLTLFILSFNVEKGYLLKPFKWVCIILSIITIVVSIITIYFPISAVMFTKPPFDIIFMIHQRPILGITLTMVFHLSAPVIIIQYGLTLYSYFKNKNRRDLLLSILFAIALFCSGTRANILAEILVLGLIYLYYKYKICHKAYFVAFMSMIFLGMAFIMIFMLLTDSSSGSSDIKSKHIESMMELFSSNPNIFFLGNGPASEYYTPGYNCYTNITEISYMDLIRLFGIFGAMSIIFIYVYPLINIFYHCDFEDFCFGISYLSYLFIAGTNPLLIVPQGFIALIIAYMYKNNDYQIELFRKQKVFARYIFKVGV